MACIVIGDIHGRSIWKNIVAKHPNDEIVIVGDYFDSKDQISPAVQIENFAQLLSFKERHAAGVTLLFGNHDFHYLPEAGETYSGYQKFHAIDIGEVVKKAIQENQVQIAVLKHHYLMSHAGLTQTWCRQHQIPFDQPVEAVNEYLHSNPEIFRFASDPENDPSGDDVEQGPLWVRPNSLQKDLLPHFFQIVGHTQMPAPHIEGRVACIDVLSYTPKYLIINDKQAIDIVTI